MITHLNEAPQSPKRVVILGGSGFLGQRVVHYLGQKNIETVSVSSKDIDLSAVESVSALRSLLRETDMVIFASALTPDKGKDIGTTMKNLAMGEHVCAALTGSPVSQVIYISSDAVYNDNEDLIREDTPCNASSLYGLMHVVREKMLSDTCQQLETPLLVLRLCALYGAQDTHSSYGPNRFLRTAMADKKITLFGKGEEKRDHVFIDDVAQLIELGLLHKSKGTLNVATGKATPFYDVAQTIVSQLDNDIEIECLPRSAPITHRHFDVSLVYQSFPPFKYTPLSDGLIETIAQTQ